MPRPESDDELRKELSEALARVDELTARAAAAERDATRYRLLLEHLNVGVFVSSLEGRMIECNERTVQMSGESRDSLLNKNLATHYENPDDRARLVAQLRGSGSVRNFETWTVHRDGKRFASSMNAVLAPIGPGGAPLILGMLEDITDRKLAEARAGEGEERFRVIAEQSMLGIVIFQDDTIRFVNQAVSDNNGYSIEEMSSWSTADMARVIHPDDAAFVIEQGRRKQAGDAGALPHYTYRIITKSGETRFIEQLDLAHAAFERAKALTGQLLAFAKGGAPVRKVGSLATRVSQCAEFALSGSNVNAELDLEAGLWNAEFDSNQLAQAFDNIVINAKQAMPSGGTLRISGRNVSAEQGPALDLPPGRYVRLSFSDRGPGISAAIVERIFDPFFTTKLEGSGIGLTAAYAILKKHDGHIEVESRPGDGATFHVWLPATTDEAPSIQASTLETQGGKGLVLVMDDDDMVRQVASSMLEHLGYQPIPTCDGAEALERTRALLAAGKQPSAAMLDLTVRCGEGGRDTVRPLRNLLPELPIIASSGYSDDPVMADPALFGFSASLRKPFRLSELDELLARLIAP